MNKLNIKYCAGGGCSFESSATWQTVAFNTFVMLLPFFFVSGIIIYKRGFDVKIVVVMCLATGGILFFSYTSAPTQTPNFRIFYYLNDHLDTPMRVTDQAGNVVWSGYYDPFGKLAYEEGTFEQNFRFPGQYHDRETGLYYNWNRYYVPELGRYNRAEPFGYLPPPNHIYAYGASNPLYYTDRDGEQAAAIALGGAGVEIGAGAGALGLGPVVLFGGAAFVGGYWVGTQIAEAIDPYIWGEPTPVPQPESTDESKNTPPDNILESTEFPRYFRSMQTVERPQF